MRKRQSAHSGPSEHTNATPKLALSTRDTKTFNTPEYRGFPNPKGSFLGS